MRLATFNILHGRSQHDGEVDLDRLASAVRTLDADILALQEVNRDQPRSHLANPDRGGRGGHGGGHPPFRGGVVRHSAIPAIPREGPERQLDHILLSGDFGTVVRSEAPDLPLSDQRALTVDLMTVDPTPTPTPTPTLTLTLTEGDHG